MKKFRDEVSKEMVKFGDFEIIEISGEKAGKYMLSKVSSEKDIARYQDMDKRVNYLLASLETFMEKIGMKESGEIKKTSIMKEDDLENNLKTIESELNSHYSTLEKLKTEQVDVKIRIRRINYFSGQAINWEKAAVLEYFTMGMGSIPISSYDGFVSAMETLPSVLEKIDIIDDEDLIAYIVPSRVKGKIMQILKTVYFKDYGIPANASEIDNNVLIRHAFQLTAAYDEELWQEKQFKKKIVEYVSILQTLQNSIKYYIAMECLKGQMASSGKICIFSGWVPAVETAGLRNLIEDVTGNKCVFMEESAEEAMSLEGLIPPTKFSNPFFIKPFEGLVSMFGLPNYRELDPTPIFAISYLLMYGAMFGDVGQGLCIALLGVLTFVIRKLKPFKDFGAIMIGVGISSMIFGFLYGAVFGYENVIMSLWMRPMDHIMDILTLAVTFGVFVIIFAMILNMINSLAEKNYARFLFSSNGIAGLGFYGPLIIAVYSMLGNRPFPAYLYIIPAVCVIVISLEKFLERWFFPSHKGEESEKPSVGLGLVDMYETAMSFLSNTISFIRVGAFALNHVGLMSVVFVFAGMSANPAVKWFALLLGNVIVIGLEGFIVAVQVLRLEYYEFFTRFYRANGKAFEGIGIYKT